MPSFYTRKGDNGFTGLLGEGRVPKYHPRMEAIGTIDEASAALGLARAVCQADQSKSLILTVQRDLYGLMAEIATPTENAQRFRAIEAARVDWLEQQTDALGEIVEIPKEFIVSGDSQAGAALDLARTIIRRAERLVSHLYHSNEIENTHLVQYLNRLSSFCFSLELLENQTAGIKKTTLAKADKNQKSG